MNLIHPCTNELFEWGCHLLSKFTHHCCSSTRMCHHLHLSLKHSSSQLYRQLSRKSRYLHFLRWTNYVVSICLDGWSCQHCTQMCRTGLHKSQTRKRFKGQMWCLKTISNGWQLARNTLDLASTATQPWGLAEQQWQLAFRFLDHNRMLQHIERLMVGFYLPWYRI